MAFIIPSKNIYDIQNPKVRDNLIDNVAVEQTVITPNNEYEVSVYNESFYEGFYYGEEKVNYGTGFSAPMGDDYSQTYYIATSYLSAKPQYVKKDIYIKELKNNHYIQSLLLGVNKDNDPNIKYSVYGYIKKGNATATVTIQGFETQISNVKKDDGTISNTTEIFEIKNTHEQTVTTGANLYEASYTAKVEVQNGDIASITKADETFIDDEKYFKISAIFLSSVDLIQLSVKNTHNYIVGGNNTSTYTANGTYVEYIPTEIQVTIYGNTIGIDLTDGTVDYGSGNKPHTLSGNELMQDSAVIGAKKVTEWLANGVLNQYKQGKETAVLLCSVDDDLNFFELGAIVEPYVLGANGKDVPMSRYPNSEPKQFVVVGTRIFYDGAVWQEITIQEYVK